MSKSRRKKENTKGHLLVGSWISGESLSDIEIIIKSHADGFKVRVIDRYDDEIADVFETKWDGGVLSFATYWNSTGRFLRCRFLAIGQDEVDYTYTYTAKETWRRTKAAK